MKLSLCLLTTGLQAAMINVPIIPVNGFGTFISFANTDGGYTAWMSGSNGINNIELNINVSPAICCVFSPGTLALSGGMIPSGMVHLDNLYSDKFLFSWRSVMIFDHQTMEPLMMIPLNNTVVETSFSLTGEGYQRMSTGTFKIVSIPEPKTIELFILGLLFYLCGLFDGINGRRK